MNQYVITVQNNQAALTFIEFVKNLDFIIKIEPVHAKKSTKQINGKKILLPKKTGDFSEIFGIWKDYNITLDQIRDKAWPERR